MKTFKIKYALVACAILASVTALTSCSKDNKTTPDPVQPVAEVKTVKGSWTGKYGAGNNEPHLFFSANIKESGLLELKDKDGKITGTGTWELTDNETFHATYKYAQIIGVTYTLNAKYNEEAETMNGSWSSNIDNGGEFFWDKD
jgi:hypothetical protein